MPAEEAVTDSVFSMLNAPGSGLVLPSGNGRYALTLLRAGLTWEQSL